VLDRRTWTDAGRFCYAARALTLGGQAVDVLGADRLGLMKKKKEEEGEGGRKEGREGEEPS